MGKTNIYIGLILILALVLRVWGINFGLPDLYHADEPIVVNHALAYGLGDLNPHFFKIPPLVSYLLFGCYGVYYLCGLLFGVFTGVSDFQNLFFSDPTSFYLIARIIFGAILGMATVFLLFQLIKKYFSIRTALISAFFLAIAFLHVRDSHYIYADIPLVLLLVACFFPIFRILEKGSWSDYLLFGLLGGMSVATKYNGVFIFAPFFLAHFLKNGIGLKSIFSLKMILGGLFSIVIYSVLNPFTWLDCRFFFSELLGQSGSEGYNGIFHHLMYSVNEGLGLPLLLAAILGIFRFAWDRNVKCLLVLSFVVIYYFVISFFGQPYDRYALPLIPFLCFFAAYFVSHYLISSLLTALLSVLIAAPSIGKDLISDYLFTQKDVRIQAREWTQISIPKGESIAFDTPFFMPKLNPSLKQKNAQPNYNVYVLTDPYSVKTLKEKNIHYVMVYRVRKNQELDFYEDLKMNADLIWRFTPYRDKNAEECFDIQPMTGGPFIWKELLSRERNGQIIEVYKLRY